MIIILYLYKNTDYGYETTTKKFTNSCRFKVILKNNDGLESLLIAVKKFSDVTEVQFNLDKCVKVTFKKGLQVKSKISLDINTEIIKLEHNKT